MMYICACAPAPFAPLACTSSRIAQAALRPSPLPPYSSGMRQDR